MNSDLISRSALLQEAYEDYHYRATLEDWELNLLQNYLDAAPAVDAVEVVRCKDCKRNPGYKPNGRNMVWCRRWRDYTPLNGFCGYGERRGDK